MAQGSQIRGHTLKGKEFFKLETSHTNLIQFLQVAGNDLWSTSATTLNCYTSQSGKIVDKYYWVAPEPITCMDVVEISSNNGESALESVPVVASGDVIFLLDSRGQIRYQIKLHSLVVGFSQQQAKTARGCPLLLYGCKDGSFGALELTKDEGIALWESSADESREAISLIHSANFVEQNLVIVRQNGEIQLYEYKDSQAACLVWEGRESEETVTGVAIGHITSSLHKEIIYSCFSGAIKSICHLQHAKRNGPLSEEVTLVKPEVEKKEQNQKISDLTKDVDLLEQQQNQLNEQKKETTKNGLQQDSVPLQSLGQVFKASYRLSLNAQQASYILNIDSQLPIHTVILQSALSIELLPQKVKQFQVTNPQRNNSSSGQRPKGLLSQIRVESSEQKKVQVELRTPEGSSGLICALIMCHGAENTGVSLEIPIKSLNLHERCRIVDFASIPHSVLSLSGAFDQQDALLWVSNCLNDVPNNIDGKKEVCYKNALLGTLLKLSFSEGSLKIASDNLSTIAIMKEQFTSDANQRKISLQVSETELNFDSLDHVLGILHPLVQGQYDVAQKHQLVDGLREIASGESDLSFLSPEYQEILKQADQIEFLFEQQPRMLGYLWSVIADLFGDASKIKGKHNVGQQLRTLRDLLTNNYSQENLRMFFSANIV